MSQIGKNHQTLNGFTNIESALMCIDPIEVINKISKFRRINIRDLTDEELFHAIQSALLNNNVFYYITNNAIYPKETSFFRVRKLNSSIISEMKLETERDFWEPPEYAVVKKGRLNKIGESLLYTSPGDPQIPIKELHLQENDWYALIKYTAIRDIKVNVIGGTYDYNALGITNNKAIMIHELYNGFLRDEFSRDVGEGTEYIYRVSEHIAKDYFDLPRDVQDAWCYSSVQDKHFYNVCFRPEPAHELLKLEGAMICKMENDDSIRPRCIAVVENDKIEFYPLGSLVQTSIFPEINLADH